MEQTLFAYAAVKYLSDRQDHKSLEVCNVDTPDSVCSVISAHPEQLLFIVVIFILALCVNGWD